MKFSDFLRVYELRAPNLMWFLGAGCSISSGIPSAEDIIWDCKSRIYCSENGINRAQVADISNPQVQRIIQDYLESKNIYPKTEEDGDEYTYYFEKAFASKTDRQTYIKELVSKAFPSYGHLVLASLAKFSKSPIVWTTNFDKLFENAVYEIYSSTNDLVVADLGEPEKAVANLDSKSFPLLVKLHGDFHSERLKNTKPELQSQDEKMRQALSKACCSYGLCVMGYSGRDKSVMDTLKESASKKGNFPHGIFWFTRSGTTPLDNVTEFIGLAKENDIDAHIIEVNTFDEALDNIRRYLGSFPEEIESLLNPRSSRKTDSPIIAESKLPPFLRLNALSLDSVPTMCKLIKCEIGGYKEIQEAIKITNTRILARRVKAGVIAFGADQEIKKTFAGHNLQSIQVYAINPDKFSYPSEEYKLISDALCESIERNTDLVVDERKDGKYLSTNEKTVQIGAFNTQVDCAISTLSGVVPNTNIEWRAACKIDLDYKFNKLWLLLSPRIILSFEEQHTDSEKNLAKSYIREQTAPRKHPAKGYFIGYNRIAASILAGWMSLITKNVKDGSVTYSALGLTEGIDPLFEISVNKVISGRSG